MRSHNQELASPAQWTAQQYGIATRFIGCFTGASKASASNELSPPPSQSLAESERATLGPAAGRRTTCLIT
jgi:hypothetical protein